MNHGLKRVLAASVSTALLALPSFSFASFDQNLRYGDRGPAVVALQEFLKEQGLFAVDVTGNFYSITLAAVKAFQRSIGVKSISGFFGPLTRAEANVMSSERNQTWLQQKSPQAIGILEATARQGFASIIVEFSAPVAPMYDSIELQRFKEQIRLTQDAIIADHFGSASNPSAGPGFDRALRTLATSPVFNLNATRAEIEALAADPRVVHIYLNFEVP